MTGAVTRVVEVAVDGERYRAPERVRSVRVSSRLSQPTQCELVIEEERDSDVWPGDWSFGARLLVRVVGDSEPLFEGEVTSVELGYSSDGAASTRVRAYHPLHRLRERQRLRVFEDLTAGDLVAELTGDLGLDLVVDDPGPRLDRIVQHRQSDFELLAEVTAAAGLYLVTHGRRIRLITLAGCGVPVDLRRGTSLWEVRVQANLDRLARQVTALGWHSQRGELFEGSASRARVRSGAAPDPDPRRIGVDGERFLVNQPARGEEQMAARAQAALDASAGRAVTVTGVAEGDPELWAGRRIVISGVAPRAAGGYVVASAVHTVDATGYRTAFSTEPPEPPRSPEATNATAITLGRVLGVDDPDGLGRVRVALPAYGDLDVGWLAVLCPGAGPDQGLVILPDVDSTVVVALPHQAPAGGVVLGGLYGTVPPPDTGVEGGRVRRWSMRTSAGQSVVVDDDAGLVRAQNRGGSFLELGSSVLKLHATTSLVIEAPGNAITVRADSVDFTRARL